MESLQYTLRNKMMLLCGIVMKFDQCLWNGVVQVTCFECALVENPSERNIKILRSDNGGEFTLGEFKVFCKEVGIKRELSTTYNPQQNGVAEREPQ